MTDDLVPGEIRVAEGSVTLNEGRETAEVTVGNTGDRPVQVGSHFHFFEANAALAFDREAAYGMRLNVPAGTAVRFEPGDERDVELVALGGGRTVHGLGGPVGGPLEREDVPERPLARAPDAGDRGAIGTEIHRANHRDRWHEDVEVVPLCGDACMDCNAMRQIDPNYLTWLLEELVDGTERNRIEVAAREAELAEVALDRMLEL